MKVKLRKITLKRLLEALYALVFFFPYIEVRQIREKFEIIDGEWYISAAIPIMLGLSFLFIMIMVLRINYLQTQIEILFYSQAILAIYIVVRELCMTSLSKNEYSGWISLMVPIIYAYTYYKSMVSLKLNKVHVLKTGIFFYAISICGVLLINIFQFGFSFNQESENRIIAPGGGPVMTGYTIALVAALVLGFRGILDSKIEKIFLVISTVVCLASGSRAGAWPLFFIIFIFWIYKKNGKISLSKVILSFALIYISFEIISVIFPRIFNTSENSRWASLLACLGVFFIQDWKLKVFGTGIGQIFPYFRWLFSKEGFYLYNQTIYKGEALLVQPHNTYMYFLLEFGIIGVLFYIGILLIGLKKIRKTPKWFGRGCFWGLFVILGFAESTIFIQPSVAGLWWIMYYFICDPSISIGNGGSYENYS